MRSVENPTVSDPAVADTDERDLPHFRSLITPGLMSVPPVPAWLRKLFQRVGIHRHP